MPSWTDEGGFNWFGKLRCKRCFGVFEAEKGEVPPHECVGGVFESQSKFPETHDPTPVLRKVKLRYPVR